MSSPLHAHDHILHLGPGQAARVCEHASTHLQRRRGHPIHVQPLSQIDAKFGQGVAPSSAGVQQGVLSISPHTGHGTLPDFLTRHVQTAIPFLIGTKFDTFAMCDEQEASGLSTRQWWRSFYNRTVYSQSTYFVLVHLLHVPECTGT
jgi:hypothetical protein